MIITFIKHFLFLEVGYQAVKLGMSCDRSDGQLGKSFSSCLTEKKCLGVLNRPGHAGWPIACVGPKKLISSSYKINAYIKGN